MAIDDRCKLFVAGLPDAISEAVLRQLFEATGGTVVEVSVPKDRATGRPRGFGFVTLSTEEEAQGARDSLDGSMQSGHRISVRPFQAAPPKRGEGRPEGGGPPGGGGGSGPPEDRTLYLGNLPYDASGPDVEQLLQQAGVTAVVRVNLPLDPQGRPRGFGFVTLGNAEAAQAAVEALREAELKGRRISASIAHARGERPARPPMRGPGQSGPPPAMGGGVGGAPRPPFRDPRWGPPPPGADRPPEGGGGGGSGGGGGGGGTSEEEERKGGGRWAKDSKKKKKSPATERTRTRREGEGMRAPRARGDWLDDEDD